MQISISNSFCLKYKKALVRYPVIIDKKYSFEEIDDMMEELFKSSWASSYKKKNSPKTSPRKNNSNNLLNEIQERGKKNETKEIKEKDVNEDVLFNNKEVKNEIKEEIINAIKDLNSKDEIITILVENVEPDAIDVEKIRTYMWKNKLTIKDFCNKCNFSYSVYKKITSGSCDFYSSALVKLAKVMNVEICDLFIKI